MYTMHHEKNEENHYEDCLETVGFLLNSEESIQEFERDLKTFRDLVVGLKTESTGELFEAKSRVENRLRKTMTRTERISVGSSRR